MSDYSKTINRKSVTKTKIASFAIIFCLVLTAVMMFNTLRVDASSQSLSITSSSWSKRSVDVTLSGAKQVKVKLNVKVKNTYRNSNKLKVTIQNTKTKKKLQAYTSYKGGKAEFSFTHAKKDIGTWKLISVTAVKQETKRGNWVPPYFSHGIFYPGRYMQHIVDKNLKTVTASNKARTMKVTCGQRTKLTISAPKTIVASDTKVTISATLKTEKGKVVKGETVHFQNIYGYVENGKIASAKMSAKTNSRGVATVTFNLRPHDEDFEVQAYYNGKAKKYCTSSIKKKVARVRENTRFGLAPVWDGSTGQKTFRAQVVVNGGKNDGKPVANVPITWLFYNTDTKKSVPNMEQYRVFTNAQGFSTISSNVKDWYNYTIVVMAGTLPNGFLYNAPKDATYNLKRVQKTVYYTLNESLLSLTGSSDGIYANTNWFNIPNGASKSALRVYGAPGVFIDADGKPLDPALTYVTASINSKPATITVELKNSSGTTVTTKTDNAVFSDDYSTLIDIITSGVGGITMAEQATITQAKVTFQLGEFGSKNGSAEFRYVPIPGKATIEKVFNQ